MRVTLNDMAYGGDAVGRDPDSGVAVFAWPAIQGETVQVDINWRRPNLVRGVVMGVDESSPVRVEPPCPYFGACGGCQWQHIDYPAQAAFKQGILRNQLSRIGGISDPDAVMAPPLQTSRAYNYRNSSHFAIDPQARSLAYFRRNSHNLIPVSECPISNEGINRLIPRLNSLISATPAPDLLAQEPRGIMQVWKIAVRHSEATDQTLVTFHTRPGGTAQPRTAQGGRGQRTRVPQRPDEGPNLDENPEANPVFPMRRRDVKRALTDLAAIEGSHDLASLTVVEVMDDGTVNLLGQTPAAASLTSEAVADTLTGAYVGDRGQARGMAGSGPPLGAWIERLGNRNYWVAPEAFFQVNTDGAELMLADVLQHVPQGLDFLIDAHAGVGTFALALADRARRVLAFETSGPAIHSGRWTALVSSVPNVDFRQGRAEDLLRALPATERPDAVLLDPPRSGCHPALLREIANRQVPLVVYVSCDPGTLARDIKLLSERYSLTSTRLIDMFPQTYHIESISVLEFRG